MDSLATTLAELTREKEQVSRQLEEATAIEKTAYARRKILDAQLYRISAALEALSTLLVSAAGEEVPL